MTSNRFNSTTRAAMRRAWAIWAGLCHERGGSALTLVAFALPVMVGFAGLGLDLSSWFSQRRVVQGVADAAAVSATYARLENGPSVTQTVLEAAALSEALRNGYEDVAGNSLTVTQIVTPPVANVTQYVEVVARMEAPLYFVSMFMDQASISAKAGAGTQWLGTQCVIALNQTAAQAILFNGTTTANIGCGVTANSDASNALAIGGSATLVANPAQAYGDIDIFGGGTLVSDYPPLPYSPRVPDPLDGESIPTPPTSCDYTSGDVSPSPSDTVSLAPAVTNGSVKICGDMIVQGDADLAPGTYFIHNGDLEARSGGTLTGDGVTIVLTGDTPSEVGIVNFNGGSAVTLSASDSTLLPGVVIVQDRTALSGSTNRFNGGTDLSLDGIIYIPNQEVEFEGGASAVDNCVQIIADTITFTGNSFIENDVTMCDDIGVTAAGTVGDGQQQVILVE